MHNFLVIAMDNFFEKYGKRIGPNWSTDQELTSTADQKTAKFSSGMSVHDNNFRWKKQHSLTNGIDILAINETKLNESVMKGEVNICGYDIVRRDRKRGGGGVCFFVKNSINFSTRRDLNIDELEIICREIQSPLSKPFLVLTWYRPRDALTGIF